MQNLTVKGLVLRQTNYGESDRILTIFTHETGIITAIAKGVRKYKSHRGGAANLFCFGEYELVSGKNMYSLRSAKLINNFYGISESIEKLSLAAYLCDLTEFFVSDTENEPDVLKLILNTLFVIANKNRNLFLIKAVFELKLLSLTGYNIDPFFCIKCHKSEAYTFSSQLGGMLCKDCCTNYHIYSTPVMEAVKYIFTNDTKNIFTFSIGDKYIKELNTLSEQFIFKISEHNFKSLSYFLSLHP